MAKEGVAGLVDYVQDLWNWMDWINYGVFLLVYIAFMSGIAFSSGMDDYSSRGWVALRDKYKASGASRMKGWP